MKKKQKSSSARYKRGWKTLKKVNSRGGERILKLLEGISPDMARLVIEFPYGDIYSRPGIDMKTREMLTIASLVTLGNAKAQLKAHIHNCLNAGATKKEIIEVIIQMSIYAGFPAALNGLFTAEEVLKERKRKRKK